MGHPQARREDTAPRTPAVVSPLLPFGLTLITAAAIIAFAVAVTGLPQLAIAVALPIAGTGIAIAGAALHR